MTGFGKGRGCRRIALAMALAGLMGSASLSVSAHERPLGDGKIAATPKQGHLLACQTRFNPNAPGAARSGPWITGARYDPAEKPVVSGSVTWPSEIAITLEGSDRVIRANNLPNHPTGVFPIARSDEAFRYDRNPNRIRAQEIVLTLPAEPAMAASPSCVPMGMIGFALSGAAIYSAVDARGRDAPAYEMQDACQGHPQERGQYHYHDRSVCLDDTRGQPGGHSDLVGYALDGFGIFGLYGENGEALTNGDLDACHGHSHTVIWDGAAKAIYHYHLTDEYPYSIGCFRGTPVRSDLAGERPPPPHGRPPPRRGQRPPPPDR